jgi:hypothetical protein
MDEETDKRSKEKYKSALMSKISFNYSKKKEIYDIENILKLNEVEHSNIYKEKKISKIATICNKIYFTILLLIGIILIFHIFHYFLSEYVRKLFINNNNL